MFFGIMCLMVWGLYIFVMKIIFKKKLGLNKAFLPLVIVSVIVSLSLGINYGFAVGADTSEGIAVHSNLSYWIIGEDNWSVNLFRKYFYYSLGISVILLALYSGLRIFKKPLTIRKL